MKILYDTLTQTYSDYPRADDEPVVGLAPHFEVYDVIEAPRPDLTEGQSISRKDTSNHTAKTLTCGWHVNEPVPVPVVVSMTSLRLALIGAGLYQNVTSAINGIPDAMEKLKAQTWWATAQNVSRDHPLVAGIAALAGRTDAQVDDIFTAAQTLDNAPL